MQFTSLALGLAYYLSTALASPVTVESRQATTCPDWGLGFGGSLLLAPTDNEASLCCVYGQSLAHCCRNKPFENDPTWSRALPCDSEYFQNSTRFGDFYVCMVDPCRDDCEGVPYVFDGPGCEK